MECNDWLVERLRWIQSRQRVLKRAIWVLMGLMGDREHLVDRLKRLFFGFVWDQGNARVLHVVDVVDGWEPFELVLDHLLILGLLTKHPLEE